MAGNAAAGPVEHVWVLFRHHEGSRIVIGGQRARQARIGIIIAATSALMLALNDVAVPFAYAQGFSATTVVLFRFAFMLLSLVVVLPLAGLSYRLPREHALHAAGSGISATIATLALLGSFALIPVSLALIILYTYPFLTALFESAHARRLPGVVEVICLLVALGGIGIVIGLADAKFSPPGLLLACISSLGYATSTFWNSVKLRIANGLVVSFHMAIFGVATTAIVLIASGSFAMGPSGISGWLPLLIACLFFAAAFIGMYKAIELIGGAPTAMIFNLEPVFVIFLAAMLLGEELTLTRAFGSALVIGAVVVSEAWRNREAVAARPIRCAADSRDRKDGDCRDRA
jgi:drug/metabolite transporter (DMT)-like permease